MKLAPLRIFVGLVYLFLFTPILLVLVNSFNADSTLTSWGGLTAHWYSVAANDETVVGAAKTSLEVAIVSTAVATLVGTLAAVGIRRSRRTLRAATSSTAYARIVMPELVLAIGLLLTFKMFNWQLGFWAVVVGHVTLFSAYAIIIVGSRLASRDGSLEEAARDLGATAFRAFWRVTLPEIAPAIAASALLIFTFSMDNVVTSLFMASGDMNTLPLVLFSLIRLSVTPEVNAIGAMLTIATGALLALFLLVNAGMPGGRSAKQPSASELRPEQTAAGRSAKSEVPR